MGVGSASGSKKANPVIINGYEVMGEDKVLRYKVAFRNPRGKPVDVVYKTYNEFQELIEGIRRDLAKEVKEKKFKCKKTIKVLAAIEKLPRFPPAKNPYKPKYLKNRKKLAENQLIELRKYFERCLPFFLMTVPNQKKEELLFESVGENLAKFVGVRLDDEKGESLIVPSQIRTESMLFHEILLTEKRAGSLLQADETERHGMPELDRAGSDLVIRHRRPEKKIRKIPASLLRSILNGREVKTYHDTLNSRQLTFCEENAKDEEAKVLVTTYNILAQSLGSNGIPWILTIPEDTEAKIDAYLKDAKVTTSCGKAVKDFSTFKSKILKSAYIVHFHKNYKSGNYLHMRKFWCCEKLESKADIPKTLFGLTFIGKDTVEYMGRDKKIHTAKTLKGVLQEYFPKELAMSSFNKIVECEKTVYSWQARGPRIFRQIALNKYEIDNISGTDCSENNEKEKLRLSIAGLTSPPKPRGIETPEPVTKKFSKQLEKGILASQSKESSKEESEAENTRENSSIGGLFSSFVGLVRGSPMSKQKAPKRKPQKLELKLKQEKEKILATSDIIALQEYDVHTASAQYFPKKKSTTFALAMSNEGYSGIFFKQPKGDGGLAIYWKRSAFAFEPWRQKGHVGHFTLECGLSVKNSAFNYDLREKWHSVKKGAKGDKVTDLSDGDRRNIALVKLIHRKTHKTIWVFCIHMMTSSRDKKGVVKYPGEVRAGELAFAKKIARMHVKKGEGVVFCGDFNCQPSDTEILSGEFGEINFDTGFDKKTKQILWPMKKESKIESFITGTSKMNHSVPNFQKFMRTPIKKIVNISSAKDSKAYEKKNLEHKKTTMESKSSKKKNSESEQSVLRLEEAFAKYHNWKPPTGKYATSVNAARSEWIDQIWYSPAVLKLYHSYPPIVASNSSFPDMENPSDHLPMRAVFTLTHNFATCPICQILHRQLRKSNDQYFYLKYETPDMPSPT